MAGTQRVGKGKNRLWTDGVSFPTNIPLYLFQNLYFYSTIQEEIL